MPVDGSTYEQGIIYWDGQNKGDTLKSCLDQCEKVKQLDMQRSHIQLAHLKERSR